jgi:hypothetical protein
MYFYKELAFIKYQNVLNMKQIFILFAIFMCSITANSQIEKQLQFELPIQQDNAHSAKPILLPVGENDRITIPTNIFSIPNTKRPFLSNLFKTIGGAAITYQTGQATINKQDQNTKRKKPLIPIGVGIALFSNKLASKKPAHLYLKIQFFDKEKNLIASNIVLVDTKPSKKDTKKNIVVTAPINGYIGVTCINAPENLTNKLLIFIEKDPQMTSLDPEDNVDSNLKFGLQSRQELVSLDRSHKAFPIVPSSLPECNFIMPSSSSMINQAKYNKTKGGTSLVKILKPERKLLPNSKAVSATNPSEKTEQNNIVATPVKSSENSNKKKTNPVTIPPFIIRQPYRIFKRNDTDDDEGSPEDLDNSNEDLIPPLAVASFSVPGVNGVGYGTSPDVYVISTPRSIYNGTAFWGSILGGGNTSSTSQSNSGYNDQGEIWVDPCDPFMPGSACYSPCPEDNLGGDSMRIDPAALKDFMESAGILPNTAVDPILRLSIEDTNGSIQFKVEGAYTDAYGNFTTFTKTNLGSPIPNYATYTTQVMSGSPVPYWPPVAYAGGTIQNYENGAYRYAIFTDNNGVQTCFPGVYILDTAVTEGDGYTLYGGEIHLSPVGNGLADMMHEYGHFIQAQVFGHAYYSLSISLTSSWSAFINPTNHRFTSTETTANALSVYYFGRGSQSAIETSSYFLTSICDD